MFEHLVQSLLRTHVFFVSILRSTPGDTPLKHRCQFFKMSTKLGPLTWHESLINNMVAAELIRPWSFAEAYNPTRPNDTNACCCLCLCLAIASFQSAWIAGVCQTLGNVPRLFCLRCHQLGLLPFATSKYRNILVGYPSCFDMKKSSHSCTGCLPHLQYSQTNSFAQTPTSKISNYHLQRDENTSPLVGAHQLHTTYHPCFLDPPKIHRKRWGVPLRNNSPTTRTLYGICRDVFSHGHSPVT